MSLLVLSVLLDCFVISRLPTAGLIPKDRWIVGWSCGTLIKSRWRSTISEEYIKYASLVSLGERSVSWNGAPRNGLCWSFVEDLFTTKWVCFSWLIYEHNLTWRSYVLIPTALEPRTLNYYDFWTDHIRPMNFWGQFIGPNWNKTPRGTELNWTTQRRIWMLIIIECWPVSAVVSRDWPMSRLRTHSFTGMSHWGGELHFEATETGTVTLFDRITRMRPFLVSRVCVHFTLYFVWTQTRRHRVGAVIGWQLNDLINYSHYFSGLPANSMHCTTGILPPAEGEIIAINRTSNGVICGGDDGKMSQRVLFCGQWSSCLLDAPMVSSWIRLWWKIILL